MSATKRAAPGREIAIPPRNRAADFSKSRAYARIWAARCALAACIFSPPPRRIRHFVVQSGWHGEAAREGSRETVVHEDLFGAVGPGEIRYPKP